MKIKEQKILILLCEEDDCTGYLTANPNLNGLRKGEIMHTCNICGGGKIVKDAQYPIYTEEEYDR